jgi:hypothetical protein
VIEGQTWVIKHVQLKNNMKVVQVKEYNRIELIKYSKRCDEWVENGGYNSRQFFPQQAFYGFYTRQGKFRGKGYVAFTEQRAVWRRTKKEAIKEFLKKI